MSCVSDAPACCASNAAVPCGSTLAASVTRARVLRQRKRSMARLRVSMTSLPNDLLRSRSNDPAVCQTWMKVSCSTSSASALSPRTFSASANSTARCARGTIAQARSCRVWQWRGSVPKRLVNGARPRSQAVVLSKQHRTVTSLVRRGQLKNRQTACFSPAR